MANNGPIAVFDSGIGGLTVAKAISSLLPNEEILYFGDTAHLPYGDKSASAIEHFSDVICQFFINKKCKLIVIACNSASAVAFDFLVEKYGKLIKFINVIEPVVEATTNNEEIKKVGVIATKATIRTNIYENKLLEKNPNLEVASLATPLLVPTIEEGFIESKISEAIIESYLCYPDFKYIDALILGCTHYPLIKNEIKTFLGEQVAVFDSNDPVAKSVASYLKVKNMERQSKEAPNHQFFVSDFTKNFELTTRLFYTELVNLEQYPIWD